MPGLVSAARGKAALLIASATLAGLIVSGCDLDEDADLERGRTVFQAECGVCHELSEAASPAGVGPSLDVSFARARANGMDQDTIEGVVQSQIAHPRPVDEDNPNYENLYMPANIVEGQDAEDVAAYVASVAGIPGIEPPPLGDAETVFLEKCGGCHQLDAAGSAGGVGPSLDEVLPGQGADMIDMSIRNPSAELSPGFENLMPVFDCNNIPQENLKELVGYLLDSTGGNEADAEKLTDECGTSAP